MNLNDFKAGTFIKQYKYRSFSPSKINHVWTWNNPEINVLLETATQSLAEFNAYSLIVPDVDLFIEMHIVKEASQSSKIEGTQTNIKDVLLEKEDLVLDKRDDWQEVHNYINTINFAVNQLKELPLSNRLLKDCHKILLENARGEYKSPGSFRTSQNWIGGSNLSDAVFIPPHDIEVPELMSDLERFWHNEEIDVPHLIKIALSHYQFETIHPFLDGNGRIGRLLITLYLIYFNFLDKPSLYLSDFFEKNRGSYYNALTKVRTDDDIIHWIKFFLNAVIKTSKNGKETFQAILKLKNNVETDILKLNRRAENAKKLLQLLYKKPFIDYNDVCEALEITPRPANELIKSFEDLGILTETTGFKRNKMYVFTSYIDIFME
jgi:Fic family protein